MLFDNKGVYEHMFNINNLTRKGSSGIIQQT